MTNMIRVGISPHVYQGIAGYRVRWSDGQQQRSYFVQTRDTAKIIKARIKAGKPFGNRWAVKC